MATHASDSFAFEYLESFALLVSSHRGVEVAEADWDAFLRQVSALAENDNVRVIGFNNGLRMSAEQTRRLREATKGSKHRVALLSPDGMSGFMMAVFRLFNRHVRGFRLDEIDAAFEHLGIRAEERDGVESAIARVRSRLHA
jgi:hypothetical protein